MKLQRYTITVAIDALLTPRIDVSAHTNGLFVKHSEALDWFESLLTTESEIADGVTATWTRSLDEVRALIAAERGK